MLERIPPVPASFFGMLLGLGGLTNGWRTASAIWGLPLWPSTVLAILTLLVWLSLVAGYGAKWLHRRAEALAELRHPVTGFFGALLAVGTEMTGLAIFPLVPIAGKVLMVAGIALHLVFVVWSQGPLWQGIRGADQTSPVMIMPAVGGNLVSAICLATLGLPDWGLLLLGAGVISWIVLEAVVLQRFISLPALPLPMRATLGIHLTPPAVACVAYLACTQGPPSILAQMLVGYGVFQAAIALRLWTWVREQPFGMGYWAYSFGISALPLAAMRLVERGDAGAIASLAPILFVAANVLIGSFFIGTIRLLLRGEIFPKPQA